MGRLPNAELAIVDESKITLYLLSNTHPAGRAKAAFFLRFGFNASSWETLREALLAHGRTGRVIWAGETEFGVKYIVDGLLNTPDGRAPHLRAVWFVAKGSTAPRLVTAYPTARGDE